MSEIPLGTVQPGDDDSAHQDEGQSGNDDSSHQNEVPLEEEGRDKGTTPNKLDPPPPGSSANSLDRKSQIEIAIIGFNGLLLVFIIGRIAFLLSVSGDSESIQNAAPVVAVLLIIAFAVIGSVARKIGKHRQETWADLLTDIMDSWRLTIFLIVVFTLTLLVNVSDRQIWVWPFTPTAVPTATLTATIPPTHTDTPTATYTPTLTSTATPSIPIFVVEITNLPFRDCPLISHPFIDYLISGEQVTILGRTENGDWYLVERETKQQVWIRPLDTDGSIYGNRRDIRITSDSCLTPTPTTTPETPVYIPTPTSTATPSIPIFVVEITGLPFRDCPRTLTAPPIGYLARGEIVTILGRTEDGDWYLVERESKERVWIKPLDTDGTIFGNQRDIGITFDSCVNPTSTPTPDTPTPSPSDTPMPVPTSTSIPCLPTAGRCIDARAVSNQDIRQHLGRESILDNGDPYRLYDGNEAFRYCSGEERNASLPTPNELEVAFQIRGFIPASPEWAKQGNQYYRVEYAVNGSSATPIAPSAPFDGSGLAFRCVT
jgi:hypothetical protein